MSWYYAENNERLGPVDDGAFDALVRAGTVRPESLVWREGMANWTSLAEAGYQPQTSNLPPPISSEDSEDSAAAPRRGVEMGMCSESGRIVPRSELIEIDGRLVSAEYKNVVLQRIREGVSTAGSSEDPEQIAQRILDRDWNITASGCSSRGWALVKSRYWLIVGATVIVYVLVVASSIIPFGQIIVQGPLFAGLYWMLLKLLRGQPASLEDAFQGFSRGWGQLIGVTLVTMLTVFACLLPGMALIGAGVAQSQEGSVSPLAVVGALLCVIGMFVGFYFVVAWIFALPLVVDKRFEMWPAMKLSKRVVSMHWWKVFNLLFCTGLVILALVFLGVTAVGLVIALVGAIANDPGVAVGLGILVGLAVVFGFFSVLPLAFSALMVAYEEIFAPVSRGT